ncbi:Histone acetyltransferase [Mycena kentingensis (nom. inval.)]|nr:Histone acetyltransferase [Mycena kentingensis (nom. inval.)]
MPATHTFNVPAERMGLVLRKPKPKPKPSRSSKPKADKANRANVPKADVEMVDAEATPTSQAEAAPTSQAEAAPTSQEGAESDRPEGENPEAEAEADVEPDLPPQPELATVLQTRESPNGSGTELYVHFVNHDKRMDKWIPEEEFTPLPADASRKRKHGDLDGPDPEYEFETIEQGQRTVTMTEEEYDLEYHKKMKRQRNIDKVYFGQWAIRTWYFSPYPLSDADEPEVPVPSANGVNGNSNAAPRVPGQRQNTNRSHLRVLDLYTGNGVRTERPWLYVCEFCFKYMTDPNQFEAHTARCTFTHPPGVKVYERGAHVIWEVDGAKEKLYCQNLALFGKLFIDVKTLFYDCENFLFYVSTEADSRCDRLRGFFSKEKQSFDNYNLACILTLPPHMKKGFGMLMIEFSYELSRRLGTVGTPERPLSDMGLRSYLAYWVAAIMRFFKQVLWVLPPGTKATSKGDITDLRSPSNESPEDDEDGTPSVVNGHSQTPSGVSPPKKKKRIVGWAGEVTDLTFLNQLSERNGEFVTRCRTYEVTGNHNGSATVNAILRCSLKEIAEATHLRVDDAAFALNEIGLLKYRLPKHLDDKRRNPGAPKGKKAKSIPAAADSPENIVETTFLHVSAAMIQRIWEERDVKEPCLKLEFCCIENSVMVKKDGQ